MLYSLFELIIRHVCDDVRKLMSYLLGIDQTWTVWSKDVSLTSFANGVSSSIIDVIVEQLASGMKKIIDDDKTTINTDFSTYRSNVTQLQSNLQSYKTQLEAGIPKYTKF